MSNEDIKANVVDNLRWDSRVDATNVTVEVSDGTVTLKGNVPSFTALTAATNNAWNVVGVTDVDNQLIVEYPSAVTVPSDADIKKNIESILAWDNDIDVTEIDVSVSNGVVTLEGNVDAYWKLYHLERKADVMGVINIVNKVAVVPTEDVLDEDIASDVEDALERNVSVDVDDVNVKVENGEVTLTGTVPSWNSYNSAENAAFYTLGVVAVDNQLVINY